MSQSKKSTIGVQSYGYSEVDTVSEFVAYEEGVDPHIVFSDTVKWGNGDIVRFVLSRGEYDTHGLKVGKYSNEIRPESPSDCHHSRQLLTDTQALRMLFSWAEQSGLDEDRVFAEIMTHEWCCEAFEELVNESRKERLIESLRYMYNSVSAEINWIVTYLSEGDFRETGHDTQFEVDVDTEHKNSCYCVASELALQYDELDYCEGFACNKYGSTPRFHAWNEIDSKVLDYTWNWTGIVADEDAIYYGRTVDRQTLEEHLARRELPVIPQQR